MIKYLLICLILAIGCGPNIKSGSIIHKNYVPAHYTYEYDILFEMIMPKYHYTKYSIVIEGKDENGKLATRYIEISKEYYKNCKIGDSFVLK